MGINDKARRIYKFAPCPYYDVEGMESWLSDLAAEGLLLRKDGFFMNITSFDRCEPRDVRYRLTASPKKLNFFSDNDGAPEDDAIEINEHYGWEYVTVRGQFHIFRTFDKGARELNTDPQVQAIAINQVRKRERSAVISSAFFALVYPLFLFRGNVVLAMLSMGSLLAISGLALLLWIFIMNVSRAVYLGKLRRELAGGGTIDNRHTWKSSAGRYRIGKIAFFVFTVIWFVISISKCSSKVLNDGELPISDYEGILPFATIKDFVDGGSYEQHDNRYSNAVSISSDILAPVIIEWQENASSKMADGKILDGLLHVEYYEAISPWLAREVAREYFVKAKWNSKWHSDFEELPAPDVNADYIAVYRDSFHFTRVIIQSDNKVLHAFFLQSSNSFILTLDEWVTILADSIG